MLAECYHILDVYNSFVILLTSDIVINRMLCNKLAAAVAFVRSFNYLGSKHHTASANYTKYQLNQDFVIQHTIIIQYTIYNMLYTLYNIQYTTYNIQYTVYSIQYTIYNIQYTIYNIQYIILQCVYMC